MSSGSTSAGGGDESRRGPDRVDSQGPTGAESGRTSATAAVGGGGTAAGMLPPGTKFGRYEIVRLIGAGGMGAVYEAQQESPRRSVALKVIRGSWLSAQMLRRFEHESQVLGRLQHPGIAQVYEAGSVRDEHGETTPFFAMELIKGVPLTEYATAKNLGTRERLELVARICDAVYHAHQKGVIHRDLKPGNILVDEAGQPKVLDFGVARATDSDIQQTTMQTDIGQLIGTVPYMSPEQVSGDPNELDTRSDVYALGVIAYELLAGRLPYDLQKKMIHEAVRVIREEDPTRLSSLNRTLRGDIETIVAKALEKEKARRYQSAEALSSDIRRYLKDEPIAARPASTWYQAGKFARRNKVLVGGIAATFLVLIAGIIGVSMMLKRALEAEHDLGLQIGETNAALTKAREAEKETAKRADELQKVSDFQSTMLSQVDPTEAGRLLSEDVQARFEAALVMAGLSEQERGVQAEQFRAHWGRVNATDAATQLIDRTILRPAVKAIDEQFKDQPVIDAKLRSALAERYVGLGLYDEALGLEERALALRRRVLGSDHRDTLVSINNVGVMLQYLRRLAEAEPYHREALAARRRVLGEEHEETISSMSNLGNVLQELGRADEALPFLLEAMETCRRVLGEDDPSTLYTTDNYAQALSDAGRLEEAEPILRGLHIRMLRVMGDEHPGTMIVQSNLSRLLQMRGKSAEAAELSKASFETFRRISGEEHPDTINAQVGLGALLRGMGDGAGAMRTLTEAMEKSERVLGPTHPLTLIAAGHIGMQLRADGRSGEAVGLLARKEPAARSRWGGVSPRALGLFLRNLGGGRKEIGEFAAAIENLVEAHGLLVQQGGEHGAEAQECARTLAELYEALNTTDPGKGHDAKAAEWRAKLPPADASAEPKAEKPKPDAPISGSP